MGVRHGRTVAISIDLQDVRLKNLAKGLGGGFHVWVGVWMSL